MKSREFARLKRAIIASLSPDLLSPKYRKQLTDGDPVETGHCAIATEALYHIAGGKEAGYVPYVCGYPDENDERVTHWWIRGPMRGQRGKGKIFDVTAGQYPYVFPYQTGRPVGFMQPQGIPSRRAQILITRVGIILSGRFR